MDRVTHSAAFSLNVGYQFAQSVNVSKILVENIIAELTPDRYDELDQIERIGSQIFSQTGIGQRTYSLWRTLWQSHKLGVSRMSNWSMALHQMNPFGSLCERPFSTTEIQGTHYGSMKSAAFRPTLY